MNSKKTNRLFLSVVLFHFVVVILLAAASRLFTFQLNIVENLLCSELILILPAILFLMCSRGSIREKLMLKRMRPSTAAMVVLFTFLTMPLTTLLNMLSMLFVDNEVMMISGDILSVSFLPMFLLMAVYGPVCEELAFRGAIYGGYRKDGNRAWGIVLSGFLFGLIHMNFNQAAYAFAIGVLLAMLVEATGSLWSSILYHVLFNAQSVCLLYLMKRFFPTMLGGAQQEFAAAGDMLCYSIGGYLILAAVCTTFAVMALVWMAHNEGRAESFRGIWEERGVKKGRMITLPLILGVLLCVAYMVLDVLFS